MRKAKREHRPRAILRSNRSSEGRDSVRVVHLLRADHASHVGGDVIQLHDTVRALQRIGIDAAASTIEGREGPPPDIVHLYNLQLPEALARNVNAARERWPQAKLALSPIFWPVRFSDALRVAGSGTLRRALRRAVKGRLAWYRYRALLETVDVLLPLSRTEQQALCSYFRIAPDERWVIVPLGLW